MLFNFHLCVYVVLAIAETRAITFSVKLSPEVAQAHYGQLLSYFTFTSGVSCSLSYEVLQGIPDPSARLYLFAVGAQNTLQFNTAASCENFYQMAIHNVSITQGKQKSTVGSFSGYFPTVLVYADRCTCKRASCSKSGEILITITLLNPNGETLSGSLMGLRVHFFGLLVFYALIVACALYFVRLVMCCTSSCEGLMESGRRLVNHDRSEVMLLPPGCEMKTLEQTHLLCCAPCSSGARDSSVLLNGTKVSTVRANSDERRLYLLTMMLCIQFASLIFSWLELSRLSRPAPVGLQSPHPVSGADGLYSHIAELLALLNQFAMLRLLMIHASELTSQSMRGHRPHQETRQSCCPATPSNSPPTSRRFAVSLSIFRFGRLLSWNRLINSILVIQVFWYIWKELTYREPVYTSPNRWPMEEHHSYWAGLGIPSPKYLPELLSETTGSEMRQSTLHAYLAALTFNSSFAFLLTAVRTAIGLTLSIRLLRISELQRSEQIRKMNANCGWLGCAWFLTHPTLLFLGALFADHVKYKFTVVGITLSQSAIFATLLFFFTRQTFLWDISSLSASLPVLKRTTGFPIGKR